MSGKLRIIGGKWRGRKFSFPEIPGLRPTPDRVRETLFNWLASVIVDARCLDLFAGSGALGLEALSRGAKEVLFVDQSPLVVQQIKQHIQLLNINHAKIEKGSAPTYLTPCLQAFDIVFLDPPFHKGLIKSCCQLLEQNQWLTENAYIYIEAESSLKLLPIPENWKIIRSKIAGQVGYHLIQRVPHDI